MDWVNISEIIWEKYSNQNHIKGINTQASPAKNYLILDFTVNSGYSIAVYSVKST